MFLVYEPYWQGPPFTASMPNEPVKENEWLQVDINANSGSDNGDGSTGWWPSGGFGVANAAGGPPLRSLNQWLNGIGTADLSPDFADATI